MEKIQIIKDFRKLLHENPEASEKEFKTRELIKDFLKEHTTVEIVDKGRWLYAIKREEGAKETIAFRADHDAIISEDGKAFHGCGHDGHTATLAGLALELEGQTTGNNIVYLFQHAEENGAGAKECVEIFDEIKIDRIYGMHNFPGIPEGVIGLRKGTLFCASKGMSVKLTGVQSHASQPEKGINPIYLISELIKKVQPLMEFKGFGVPVEIDDTKFSMMTICTIVNVKVGEKAFGVSPSTGEINMTLRAEKDEDLKLLQKVIENFVEKKAKEQGIEYKFEFFDEFPDTSSDDKEVERMMNLFKANNFEYVILEDPYRTSEDFGHYTKKVPGAFFVMGDGVDYPSIHTIQYEYPDVILKKSIEAFKLLAMS